MRHLFAGLVMVAGTVGTLALVAVMNRAVPPKADAVAKAAATFDVRPPPPKKAKPKPKPKPKPRPKQARSRRAPPPVLAAGLGGVELGLGDLGAGLGVEANALVGDTASPRDLVMTEDSVDQPPRAVQRAAPAYPPRARAKNVTGRVVLSLLVGPRGEVQRIKVLESEPRGVFEEAAQEAVRRWRFSPALYRGEPVRVWARQVVRFELG